MSEPDAWFVIENGRDIVRIRRAAIVAVTAELPDRVVVHFNGEYYRYRTECAREESDRVQEWLDGVSNDGMFADLVLRAAVV